MNARLSELDREWRHDRQRGYRGWDRFHGPSHGAHAFPYQGMNLQITDEEAALLERELRNIIDKDRSLLAAYLANNLR